jgi:heterotetrameric sarcosine oxidase beta subunit
MVSEPVKPILDTVILSPGTGAYVSQSDKGEIVMGAMLDLFPSYAQRGSFAVKQAIIAATLELFPSFSRLNLMRQWAGIVDVVHDSSPIIGPTPLPNLYINCGWGTGGFKAIPVGGWTFAHVLATGSSPVASSTKPRRRGLRTNDADPMHLLWSARRERVRVRRHVAPGAAGFGTKRPRLGRILVL